MRARSAGAACARTTFDCELFADTGKGTVSVPTCNIYEPVSERYSLSQAEQDARGHLQGYLAGIGMTIGTVFGRKAGEGAARHAGR